jgi:hypothetical protein
MPYDFTFASVALMSGETQPVPNPQRRQVLEYSEVATSETALPIGLRPLALLLPRTGSLAVGERPLGPVSHPEQVVAGSLAFVEAIASALPLDAEDERIIDDLMSKRAASLSIRPLRKREPGR